MELVVIGLGRLGSNMVRRLRQAGHQCVVDDLDPKAVGTIVKEKAVGSKSLEGLAHKLTMPRGIWGADRGYCLKIGGDKGMSRHLDQVLTALSQRFSFRGEDDFAGKVRSALRYQFGGHEQKTGTEKADTT
jgi:6-phosphogluconate dehydrogenase (decarboxylating)